MSTNNKEPSSNCTLEEASDAPYAEWPPYFHDPAERGSFRVPLLRPTKASASSHDTKKKQNKRAGGQEEDQHIPHRMLSTTLYNHCSPRAPYVALRCHDRAVNVLPFAYTSTGYPTTNGKPPHVYPAFSSLKAVGIHSMDLPPQETIVISKALIKSCRLSGNTSCELEDSIRSAGEPPKRVGPASLYETPMDTLLRIEWKRVAQLFERKRKKEPTAAHASNQEKPVTQSQYLAQFPDGVHLIHTSDLLERLVIRGELPTEAPGWVASYTTHTPGSTSPPVTKTATTSKSSSNAAEDSAPQYILAKPPMGLSPVQHTLSAVSTFSHVTIYFTVHQDSRILLNTPIQTYTAFIPTRKITAHRLLFITRDERPACEHETAIASLNGSNTDLTGFPPLRPPPPTPEPYRFTNIPVVENGQRLFLHDLMAPAGSNAPAGGGCHSQGKNGPTPLFRGANADAQTISVLPCTVSVSPMILLGNEHGDLLLMDIFNSEVALRLNYESPSVSAAPAGGSGSASPTTATAGGQTSSSTGSSSRTGTGHSGKLVYSAVTCIEEVESGVEKHLSSLIAATAAAKRDEEESVIPYLGLEATNTASNASQRSTVSPSIFAIGFEDGQVLLICIMNEGGWILRHLQHQFGDHPIESIALRGYDFFKRLWNSYEPSDPMPSPMTISSKPMKAFDATGSSGGSGSNKRHALLGTTFSTSPPSSSSSLTSRTYVMDTTLCSNVRDDALGVYAAQACGLPPYQVKPLTSSASPLHSGPLAAITCHGDTILLVQLPGMEILCGISAKEYNAVGSILSLQWIPSQRSTILVPDLLIAASEDDTLTAFYVSTSSSASSTFSSNRPGGPGVGVLPSAVPVLFSGSGGTWSGGGGMNRLWVGTGSAVCPSSAATSSPLHPSASAVAPTSSVSGTFSPPPRTLALKVLEKKLFHKSWVSGLAQLPLVVPRYRGGRGMPQYHGVVLVAASYDGSVSFWPHIFSAGQSFSASFGSAGTASRDGRSSFVHSPKQESVQLSPFTGSAASSSRVGPKASPRKLPPGEKSSLLQIHVEKQKGSGVEAAADPAGKASPRVLPQPWEIEKHLTRLSRCGAEREEMEELASATAGGVGEGRLLLIHGPTAVYRLHKDLVLQTLCGGTGTSFFMISVSCRADIRFWSLKLHE